MWKHDRVVKPAGDAALVVEFGTAIDPEINRKVQVLNAKVQKIDGIVETVPTFRSLMILYDPLMISYRKLKKSIRRIPVDAVETVDKGRLIEIPVCYGGAYGEDLKDVAEHAGLTEDEVIKRHSEREYPVYMMGFLPGFPYLGGMDPQLETPRLKTPRTVIPAGSVGIGGAQTGIYPLESPGGWRLIGRTPLRLYDPEGETPVLLRAGDRLRFIPITEEEFLKWPLK